MTEPPNESLPILETKESTDVISDQHILMLKLREIAQLSTIADTAPIFRDAAAGHGGTGTNEAAHSKEKIRRFNNLCVLDYEHPYAIPNIVLNREDENGTMLRLSTLQLSLLVPRIRIFKIIYSPSLRKEYKVELPFDDIASKEDLERIFTSRAGLGSGTGIKSFQWKSMAKNEANLSQFSATLTLFIQNIEELAQIRNSTTVNGQEFSVSILDLLYQKPNLRSGLNEGSNTFDPKYFGIKVEVGWHLDAMNKETFRNESIRSNEDPDKVYDVVQSQKNIYYLTLTTHNFAFNEDGSIELSIDYIASSEIEASDPIKANVLRLSDDAERQLKNATDRLKNANRELNALSYQKPEETKPANDMQPARRGGIARGSDADIVYVDQALLKQDRIKKEREDAIKDLGELKKNQKVERMTSIIDSLIRKNLVNSMFIPKSDYESLSSLRSVFIDDTESFDIVNKQIGEVKGNIKITPQNSLNWSSKQSISNSNEVGSGQESGVGSNSTNIQTVSYEDIPRDPNSIKKIDDVQISFFLLGDLLDTVLTHVFNDEENSLDPSQATFLNKTNRILLGPITYYDFGSIEDSGLVMRTKGTATQKGELVSVYRGKQTTINIADIPISIKEYSKWFMNTVINNDNLNYFSFLDFSKALIDDLIISSLRSDGFKFAPKQQVRINMLPFSAPKSPHNEELFASIVESGNNPTKSFRFRLDPNKNTGGTQNTLRPFLSLNTEGEKQNYILFYGVNQPPFDRVADEQSDLTQKIFHIYIGEERGLVKKVNFSRDDNPRLRANNIQMNNPDKQQDGMIIREKYSGKFDFFGNFLFTPGQQIFVHPTYPGLKGRNVRENIFRNLGLGGYYFILETDNRITNGEFTTTVTTKWNAFGDGKMNIGDQLDGTIVETDSLHEDHALEQSVANVPARVVSG